MEKLIPRIELPNTKQLVSKIGLGCMSLDSFQGVHVSEQQGLKIIQQALEQGVNFFDTAYIYGKNEELLNKAMKKYGREKFILASKVPTFKFDMTPIPGTKQNIKKYCSESLKRLGIEKIDLYYLHRADPKIPIEFQAEAFKELIEEGKIGAYGISEASENTIRRAHKICPLTAVQEEYSLFSRDIETNGVLDACRELGISIVAYRPLGVGMLSGKMKKGKIEKIGSRSFVPRFREENIDKNLKLVEELKKIANQLDCTAGQLALGWLLAKQENIIPIPGTKQEKYLTENNQAANINIPQQIIKQLDEMFPVNVAYGGRYPEGFQKLSNITTVELN